MRSDAMTTSIQLNAKNVLRGLSALVVGALLFSGVCSSTGACVGTGGVLNSPVCKEAWTSDECQEFADLEVNGANWTFNSGDSCLDRGFTEECSDGSFREPGAC